ncbi:hypothetical protein BG55_20210 [Erwinia mallotivora]|uniref:Uncharacterized protein n=1 Tax=Erwinia mallotivora TaxID=69222 RepID=A0A014LWF0_9GAMM|nr:hypothetical protein BG55_20210 [Erwinia mallotivora]
MFSFRYSEAAIFKGESDCCPVDEADCDATIAEAVAQKSSVLYILIMTMVKLQQVRFTQYTTQLRCSQPLGFSWLSLSDMSFCLTTLLHPH